jgi:3-oxoadipate enol-lactonase
MQTGYTDINGATLYYETAGSGQPLIFLHGMGLDCHMWDSQFDTFAESYHVIRYDLRGFGKSTLPTGDYAHHNDLYALMQHFGIQKANLVGLSMGGRVIIDFAIIYPDAVQSLTLVDAAVHGYQAKENASTVAVGNAAKEHGAKAANEMWLKHDLFTPANRNPTVAAQLKNIIDNYSGWHWVNKNPWPPIEPHAIHRVHNVTAPSLIIVGELDIPDMLTIADLLHEKINGSKKIVMYNVGHMPNMEDPETFNNHVRAFLSTVAPHAG